ncbi:MAG: 23S rRNA (guanosine(2251)-2'-O)-methyltransferase RlmB [Clostridia bacterium]|nr:23S rRNA (guanosine(2251)-2'-O)-methyltransferase RlmB [Clostridia bacterium]
MTYQKNDFPKRPSSKDTGVRGENRGYGAKNGGKRYDDDKSYGKKPFNRQNDDKPYGKKPFNRQNDDKPYGKKPFNRQNDDKPYGKKPFRRDENQKPYDRKRDFDERKPREQQNETDEQPYLLIGRNAVREAIKSGRSIDRILVTNERDGSLGEIVMLAREQKLVVREVDRKKLDELCMPFGHGGKTANHQGIVAYAAGVTYCEIADILAVAEERGEAPFVVVLDEIEDPHNLGSIIRSADCAGAHGVVIGKRRSASVTAAAVKASAGATEYVKIARVVNINAALAQLKSAGLWVAGADMKGENMRTQVLKGPLALVIGNEGEGLSKLVRDNCDFLVSIPMQGHIDSLNAGVAAAILMFEKKRQDAEA